MIADHLKRSIEEGEVPPTSSPRTYWEWHARFPELGQFLGGWFSQDTPDEFPDHDAALRDYTATTDPQLVARLRVSSTNCSPSKSPNTPSRWRSWAWNNPPRPSSWLAHLADGLGGFEADYGP